MSETTRRRIPTWLVVVASVLVGVALGAGVLSAQAQTEETGPEAPDREAAVQAFRDCAEEAGITLPDLRRHRRDRERLSDDERAAIADAREACGDLLPHAEERAALRQCLTDAGVLDADGQRVGERDAFRDAARTCAAEQGIDLRRLARRCGPGRIGRHG